MADLGSVPVHSAPQLTQRWRRIAAALGPGLIVMLADNDAGSLTFRTSREANRTNFRLSSARGQGLPRGASASMSFSVSPSQACMSFLAFR